MAYNKLFPIKMQRLPPETFIKICSFLPPSDLLSLSQVCCQFHGYLHAPDSSATQQVWKESRLQFMPSEKSPPPKGMSEEKYVELLLKARGCQICKRNKKRKIHLEFAIRCYEKCHYYKTVR